MSEMKESKVRWYLKIAQVVAEKSPCSRKKCGVVIVKNDAILSTGYNGTVRGTLNCGTEVSCLKDLFGEASYFKEGVTSYQYCPVVHAEINAIINASRSGVSILDSTMFFLTTEEHGMTPCQNCRRFMVNAGIKDFWTMTKDRQLIHEIVSDYIKMDNDWMKDMEQKGQGIGK